MAKIVFEKGDVFSYVEGAGVVVDDNVAVLVKGEGGRDGFEIEKGNIPADASIEVMDHMKFEVQMALKGALVAVT